METRTNLICCRNYCRCWTLQNGPTHVYRILQHSIDSFINNQKKKKKIYWKVEFNTHYVLLIKRIINTASDMRILTDTHTRTHCRNPTCPALHTASFYRSVFLSALNSKPVLCFLVSEKTKFSYCELCNFRFIFEGKANTSIVRIFVDIYFHYQFKKNSVWIILQPWYYVCKNINILEHSHVNLDNYMKLQPSYLI